MLSTAGRGRRYLREHASVIFGTTNASPPWKQAQSDQIIKNLQRENALIATAWYDLNSRLQSNHVVLQRRQDAPKSWLNRQRVMVNATPRR